jgi:exosortase E/protease (VPEID-CTERM system)
LALRLLLVVTLLAIETLLVSYLIQATPVDELTGAAAVVRHTQHWLFRFMIAYAGSLAILVYLRGPASLAALSGLGSEAPIRIRWALVHAGLLVPFGYLSAWLYGASSALPFAVLAVAWHGCAIAAALALFAAMAPLPVWVGAIRQTGRLPLFALLPAAAAVAAIQTSQLLWGPAATLTFQLVQMLLQPVCPTLKADPATLTIATQHFAVIIAEVCSGLEGIGLMLAFCVAWLWCFRREYFFPQALIVVPFGVVLVFALNAVRIAALVLIGDAGYARIASVGFHSQAGWIAFNLAAFAVAILARRSTWISRTARTPRTAGQPASAARMNETAAYLMPLLAILAAGMVAHALSAGFDWLYPMRLGAAAVALWYYRRCYASLDWSCTWRAPAAGAALFLVWVAAAGLLTKRTPEPAALALLPTAQRGLWIGCRALAATVTVPLAEELAYRGYLMRRLMHPRFESVAFGVVRWPALMLSSLAFGLTHGALWPAGILAGIAYGALAIRSGRLGESVIAHATTNALLAAYVLLFEQWQLW